MRRCRSVWHGMCLGVIAGLTVVPAVYADSLAKEVKRLANDILETKRSAGLAIAIDHGGRMLLNEGYGYADLENKVRATPETLYRIGSVTKQFTAVAIVQLQLAGKLRIEDKVNTLLREYPTPPKPVTIRHLLQHTSGIPSVTSLPSYLPNMAKDITHADMISRFASLPLEFDPGSKWNYSNSGYYVLGMVIEKASGLSYAEYLKKHLLAPAGMYRTNYETVGLQRAQGYRRNSNELVVAEPISMTQPFAAGALVSTAGDLVAWQRALVEKRLTPPDALARLTADLVKMNNMAEEQYGYGIGVSTRDCHRVISHGGGINGFTSLLAYYPEADLTMAILANTEGFNTAALTGRLIEALHLSAKDQIREESREEVKWITEAFPDGPSDAFKANSVWTGIAEQSRPELFYPMILFVKRRCGETFKGTTWYPTLENGLVTVTGQIDGNGAMTFSEDEVIFGEANEQRPGVLAGTKYAATLRKMTLKGNGEWLDPKAKEGITVKFLLKLAE